MLKPLDINQTTFNALNNAATAVYEAVYEAASDAVSGVDASHFHKTFTNSINLKWRIIFIKNQNSESEKNVQCMIFLL